MTPYEHALLSQRDFGVEVEDTLFIHEWLDQTKTHFPDWRHRAILHNSLGMKLAEDVFGPSIKCKNGKVLSVREVVRRHIIQDLGWVPTVKDWMAHAKYNRIEKTELSSPNKRDLQWLASYRHEEKEKHESTADA